MDVATVENLTMSSLKPDDCIQRAVISTRSRLVGEYRSADDPDLFVTHAYRQGSEISKGLFENSSSQNFLVATFRTGPVGETVVVPDYSYHGEFLATHFSILYGKHFYFHGFQESHGLFRIPRNLDLGPSTLFQLPPFNHKPRACVPTPLNLSEIVRIQSILHNPLGSEASRTLFTAGQFYNRALSQMEEHPELGYLDLITCGEIIASNLDIPQDKLDDEQLVSMLRRIESELEGGASVVSWIRNRLYQVRGRFAALADLLDEYFFSHPEPREAGSFSLSLKADETESAMKAAYDLRSRYVHTGIRFGSWVRADPQFERCPGSPVIDDKKLMKIFKRAPNLSGLERIMRYALLRVATDAGADLTDLYLDTPSERET